MKLLNLAIALFMSSLVFAGPIKPVKKAVDVSKSNITWTASKVTGKHFGNVKIKSGTVEVDGNKLIGGNFVVDMTSLTVEDLQGKGKENLENHLKSDDFFSIANFGEATLKITKVTAKAMAGDYIVDADLTIKGVKSPVKFDAKLDGSMATAKIKIDRTKYDIKYRSGNYFQDLGDKLIYDEFDLEVNLAY
jgi:polyisoprenoid-binding protein YceI